MLVGLRGLFRLLRDARSLIRASHPFTVTPLEAALRHRLPPQIIVSQATSLKHSFFRSFLNATSLPAQQAGVF